MQAISNISRSLVLAFKASRLLFLIITVFSFVYGLSYGFIAKFSADFFAALSGFNSPVEYAGSGINEDQIFLRLGLFLAVIIFNYFLNGLLNQLFELLASRTTIKAKEVIHEKLNKKTLSEYENTEFLDQLESLDTAAFMIGYTGIIALTILTTTFVSIISISAVYYNFHPCLGLVVLVLLVPNFITLIRKLKVSDDLKTEIAKSGRAVNNNLNMLISREFIKEVRQLSAAPFLKGLYRISRKKHMRNEIEMNRAHAGLELKNKIASLFFYLLVIVYIIYLFVGGKITAGQLSSVFLTLAGFMVIVEEMFFNELGVISRFYPHLSIYFAVIDRPDAPLPDAEINTAPGIVMQNVSFAYGDENVIESVNLKIDAGSKVCLVGENAAGKTTISKLMMGLYKPSKGRVFIGGKSTDEYQFSKGVSAVFQDAAVYALNLSDNIKISGFSDGDADIPPEFSQILWDDLPERDEILSRDFGSVDLSMGQAQKLQILRGFYRKSHFMVLDEPTASIDPESEADLAKWTDKNLEGKTSVIITHRMSLAKFADRILVMDKGRIVEDGSFQNLMNKKERFFELFENQSQWYDPHPKI